MKQLIIAPIDSNGALVLYKLLRVNSKTGPWLLGYVWTDRTEDFILAAYAKRKKPLQTIEFL
jgi:hypothetical protein